MLVSISGTHCTGKSTLLTSLQSLKSLKDYTFRNGPTRSLKDKGLPINNDQSNNYDSTQLGCLEWDLKGLDLESKDIIFDRSILDTYIYTKYLHNQKKVSDKCLDHVKDVWDQKKSLYDVFIIPSMEDIPLVGDKYRNTDRSFREDVNHMFNLELERISRSCSLHFISGTNEERVKKIENLIKLEQNLRLKKNGK